VMQMAMLSNYYKFRKPDSALYYGNEGTSLAAKINFPKGQVVNMGFMVAAQNSLGNYTNALKINLQALNIADRNNLLNNKAILLLTMGNTYSLSKNYDQSLKVLKESLFYFDSLRAERMTIVTKTYIGEVYLMKYQLDSALYFTQSAYENAVSIDDNYVLYHVLPVLAQIHQKLGNTGFALSYFRHSLQVAHTGYLFLNPNLSIAKLFEEINQLDSSIFYAEKSLAIAQESGFFSSISDAGIFLAEIYEKRDLKKAVQFHTLAIAYRDSLDNLRNVTALQSFIDFDKMEREYQLETTKTEFQNQLRMNAFMGITFTLVVIAVLLLRNVKMKQRAKVKIEMAYDQLKSTQSQLIQSEKMASLGDLTAGIAHEIQNPLNFVNNFSDVSQDLIDEMQEELNLGNPDVARDISEDVKENLGKIHHHGERASSIVKGMLQHSRSSNGQKEPTDINALADEYLRLAYHGLRAKDKSFNADFKTDFDETLPKINVIPQDIGRVLLNLINNAFYACTERSRSASSEYQPMVIVLTKMHSNSIEICVKDNGEGIPADIKDKIFQPFFTTKPTGSGTGLGLSLSYDIVKAHGGELKVDTNKGTTFIIQLLITE